MFLKSLHKIIVSILSASFFISALANVTVNATESTTNDSADALSKLTQELCPPIEALTQNTDDTWSAPGGWKSHSPSFLKSVTQFAGAQWIGVKLGEIVCSYSKGGNRFPVNLERATLALSPIGGGWSADKGGYKDCVSNDPKQCRFFRPPTEKHGNLYDEIDFYKGQAIDNSSY